MRAPILRAPGRLCCPPVHSRLQIQPHLLFSCSRKHAPLLWTTFCSRSLSLQHVLWPSILEASTQLTISLKTVYFTRMTQSEVDLGQDTRKSWPEVFSSYQDTHWADLRVRPWSRELASPLKVRRSSGLGASAQIQCRTRQDPSPPWYSSSSSVK